MTLRHWSRVTPYTSPCGLAECCVFAKQSPGPLHCGSPRRGEASPPHRGERPFFRSYGAGLPSSLTWFLPSTSVYSTCPPVSVCGTDRYGFVTFRRFSWRHGVNTFGTGEPAPPHHGSAWRGTHLTIPRPARLDRHFQSPAHLPFRVTPSLAISGPGMLTWMPSATHFCLALGPD